MGSNVIVTTIVIIYLICMLLIGYLSSKKITSNSDFVVAGRRLGPVLLAGTLAATEIGGGSSLGVVQQGMQNHGLSGAWYIITMGLAFIILAFLAPKFRASEVNTVSEYFRRRYGKTAGLITAIIMAGALIGATTAQLLASATILSVMLNLDATVALIIVTVIITVYSVMGGLWSVTITDFVQVFLIVAGMIIAVPFASRLAGGWDNVVANVPAGTFDMFKGYSVMDVISLTIMYVCTFAIGQEAVSRFYAARDEKAARQGSFIAAGVNFIYAFIPAILGIMVLALVNMGTFDAAQFESVGARYALPVLAMNAMPAVICGLLFAGVISATMSSADSDILGAGAIIGNDIYRAAFKPKASDKEVMLVTKIAMVISAVLAMLFGMFNTGSIIDILLFAFTLRAAGAFIPYILGHYWDKSSTAGTVAALISGTLVVLYLNYFSTNGLFGLPVSQPIVPGVLVSLIFFLIFSKLMPPKQFTTELTPDDF